MHGNNRYRSFSFLFRKFAKCENKAKYEAYFASTGEILSAHPFSPVEAKECSLSANDYFNLSSELFMELGLKPDEEPIGCTLKFGLMGSPASQKTFSFTEEELLRRYSSPVALEENQEEASDSPDLKEDEEPTFEEPLSNEEDLASAEEAPVEKEPIEEEVAEEEEAALEEEQDQEDESIEEEPEPVEEEIKTAEEEEQDQEGINDDASSEDDSSETILDVIKGDEFLENLYPSFRKDKTMIGLIAKELIMAKRAK